MTIVAGGYHSAMQLLRATGYRRMPWKNGGGETREILISPLGASLDTLDWRISLATIASDGPFSAFDGIQRTLCVIRGAGIHLQVANAPPELLLEHSPPFTFAGEVAASSTLVAGPTVDLNVMSRRNRIRHAVKRLSIEAALQLPTSAGTTIVFCQHGSLCCAVDEAPSRLGVEDCVVVEGGTAPLHLNATEPATVIVIEIGSAPCGREDCIDR